MNYTAIHINGHLLSDDILHQIETDPNLLGNRPVDFGFESSVVSKIDYAWSSLRNDWQLFADRSTTRDPYGTTLVRKIMTRFLSLLDYELDRQECQISRNERLFSIDYLVHDLDDMPIIIVGDRTSNIDIDTLDKSTLDYRANSGRRTKSPHATMLDYLNNTENVYGIITNGHTLRIIRNAGQLVKLTYVEFDLRRMVEEDLYAEFSVMFRLLHASRFHRIGDDPSVMERWFNQSIDSGNRIRAGLSDAVQHAMEILGQSLVENDGDGNDALRQAFSSGELTAADINKELIHFIYRVLFLFIIEDRNLVYNVPDTSSDDYDRISRFQEIYMHHYAVTRLRGLSELYYLFDSRYHDLWIGMMDTFRLFEDKGFGAKLGIEPLGGVLFSSDTLRWMSRCSINNDQLLRAFSCLNEFTDASGIKVKINYSSLDVEEFGSVYEGILEMRAVVIKGNTPSEWRFGFGSGLDRKSSSSYYTRPDLVQSLIRTTLEPVIKERITSAKTKEEKIQKLLSLKVCDAASGSGHIVLAMARTIAWYVSSLRTGEDNPASLDYREALREVIQKCVYAVDYNPDAVELCKVVLWIEGYCAGRPLSFLDSHIRCGNSVVGVCSLESLLDGVPKDAFYATDKDTKKTVVELNKAALQDVSLVRTGQSFGSSVSLFGNEFTIQSIGTEQIGLADQVSEISALPEDTLQQQIAKKKRWEELMVSPRVECLRRACDIYTYAFYRQFTPDDFDADLDIGGTLRSLNLPYTRTVYQALQEIKYLDDPDGDYDAQRIPDEMRREVQEAARRYRFFHWCVEFPEVFANGGGFDVMCGNPPWDKIKIEDKKWFEQQGRPDIVNAGTAAQRKKVISNLPETDPDLYRTYCQAQADAEAMSRFVRFSGRFPLTATGDIDLYPLFAEHNMNSSREAWGLVVPTGIATLDSNKVFFAKLIDENRLISLYDFENKEGLFNIHRMLKFCLLTAGKAQDAPRKVSGGFYLTRLDHLLDPNRIYSINTQDFARLNPNTKTCPTFRTSRDAELTAKIYRNSTILWNDNTGENPWDVRFMSMIHMSSDSYLFRTFEQMTNAGAILQGNHFWLDDVEYVPLYEGKMFWHYNHHFGTWPTEGERPNAIDMPSVDEFNDPNSEIMPWYWIPKTEADGRLVKTNSKGDVIWEWKHPWLMAWRDITGATNERTFVVSSVPDSDAAGVGVGNTATLLFEERGSVPAALLQGMMSSLVFDYATRQKISSTHASITYVKQFPVLTPEQIHESGWEQAIVERVARLVWFNHDMDAWMEELRAECPAEWSLPEQVVIWDEEQRAIWQAELDTIFALLYGLNTEELRYILDPEDICGPGCINETFRVLKDRELREYGQYRTRSLVLDAWHRFNFDNPHS